MQKLLFWRSVWATYGRAVDSVWPWNHLTKGVSVSPQIVLWHDFLSHVSNVWNLLRPPELEWFERAKDERNTSLGSHVPHSRVWCEDLQSLGLSTKWGFGAWTHLESKPYWVFSGRFPHGLAFAVISAGSYPICPYHLNQITKSPKLVECWWT